jgi:hypothetical protein
MEPITEAAQRAAKAWFAAIFPIVVALAAGVGGLADIDVKAWAGIVGLATCQWVGVYFKTNREV